MPKFEETAAQVQHRQELARMRAAMEQVERRAADQEKLLKERMELIERLEAQLAWKRGKS